MEINSTLGVSIGFVIGIAVGCLAEKRDASRRMRYYRSLTKAMLNNLEGMADGAESAKQSHDRP